MEFCRTRTIILAVLAGAMWAGAQSTFSLSGQWEGERSGKRIAIDFLPNGVFFLVTSPDERAEIRGHYSRQGETLQLLPEGQFFPDRYSVYFNGNDALTLSSSDGERIVLKRRSPLSADKPAGPASFRSDPVVFQRVWEPNERAFSLLVPQGWKISGGVFRVDPARVNGLGNSASPKCDFSVSGDERGTVMIRWLPSWNYADLSRNSMGAGKMQPGQAYNGMRVRPLLDARQFLSEMIRSERPQATAIRLIAEDPMAEINEALAHKSETANADLRKAGLDPIRYASLAVLVEYHEAGQQYREALFTTTADNRGGASMWSNLNTVMFRAPAAEFEKWKPVLDIVRTSREPAADWLKSLETSMGAGARNDWELQFSLEAQTAALAGTRRSAGAAIGSDRWLLPDPENGYPASWESDRGEILFAAEAGFDPNRSDAFKDRNWKRSR